MFGRRHLLVSTIASVLAFSFGRDVRADDSPAGASVFSHEDVEGPAIDAFTIAPRTSRSIATGASSPTTTTFADLQALRAPGSYEVRFSAKGDALRIPHCAGRKRVFVDGKIRDGGSNGPVVSGPVVRTLDGSSAHDVRIEIDVSKYEKRIACGEAPRAGRRTTTTEGLTTISFTSPDAAKGGGRAVVFVPRGHDVTKPAALLVGTHPWNGTPWTYAAYRELLEEAQAKDVLLLMPSGLGNSLYTQAAEDEVLRAMDAFCKHIAVDPTRVSIWGASMGGAGATTIGFHHPDRFAFVASYFGDSRYDLTTYVKSLLPTEADARRVNALDIVENARHVPVWLIHGEADKVSKIEQSEMLDRAMRARGLSVRFDRVPGMGHEAPLVVKFLRDVVDRSSAARAPVHPTRVSYRSVRAEDTGAYGVRIEKSGKADAFVDLERRDGEIFVTHADGIATMTLASGALGAHGSESVRFARDVTKRPVVRWENGSALPLAAP